MASWSEVKGLKYLILTHTTYTIFNIDHHTNPRSIIHYRLLPEWIMWIWKYCHHQGVRRSRYLLWRSFQLSRRYMTSSSFRFVSHQDDLIWFDFWCFNATFSNISAISWQPVLVVKEARVHGENIDHGQATCNFYHLRLRVECILFCNLQSRARTHVVLVIGLHELLGNPTT